jgi:uncharacterized protein|tara:strand:- start:279 stop:1088 length:810 start_codon:yes stop_codon:yes gene_type:complete
MSYSQHLEILQADLASMKNVIVAFSGGADSSFLAHVAHNILGANHCHVVTAVSPSLSISDYQDAANLASEWGFRWSTVETNEMESEQYLINDSDRCGYCKEALMDSLIPIAEQESATVLLGVNLDDLGDHRPGQTVAASHGARFPLVDAGFTKNAVRSTSQELGLRTWDKPAAPCLSSRLPYGTPVTLARLSAVEKAEKSLKQLGFGDLRVRHYDKTARLEIPISEIDNVLLKREEIVAVVQSAGYLYVTLDLEGLRSGNLNQELGAYD